MTGRRWSAALLGAAVLVLAGCAGVPERSAPQVAGEAPTDTQPNRPAVGFEAPTPGPGDDQRTIVNGFLRAQISPDSDYSASRQFLTPDAADAWDPGTMVRIVDEGKSYVGTPDDQGDVTFQTRQVGVVATDGSYSPTPTRTNRAGQERPDVYRFHMVQVDGEWRIADPPNGLILGQTLFNIGYSEYSLYFFDPAQKQLVPDLRYFPVTYSAGSLATLLLDGLIGGPSKALADAVSSPLAEGVRIAGNVVQDKDSSVLRVYLEGLGTKGEVVRQAAGAQVTWTLDQVGTAGVEIVDGGRPLQFDGVPRPSKPGDWQTFSPDSRGLGTAGYYLRGNAVHTTEGTPVDGPAGAGEYALTSIAVSMSNDQTGGRRLAGVRGPVGAQELLVGDLGGPLTPLLAARTLTTPTWDSASGDVWTVRDGSVITRVTPSGLPAPVQAEGLVGLEPVHQLRLSRDGARVAMIAGDPARLYVGRVVRNEAGVQVSVEGFVHVLAEVDEALDMAWASGTRLFVVAADQSGRVVRTVSVDGAEVRSEPRDNLPGPVTDVAAAPNLRVLVVSDGGIWQKAGEAWAPLLGDRAAQGTAPTYPG